ncbi:MAG: L,D-transpeptidase [Gaiellaceae bacterium]
MLRSRSTPLLAVLACAVLVPVPAVAGTAMLPPATGTWGAASPKLEPKPKPTRIAPGVTVAGIRVGKLTPAAAEARVRFRIGASLPLRAGNLRIRVRPLQIGLRPYVRSAVRAAFRARPGTRVKLRVQVRGAAVRAYVRRVARRFAREPLSSQLSLRGIQPYLTPAAPGRRIRVERATRAIVFALNHNQRRLVRLPVERTAPRVTRSSYGPVIVIRRGSNQLHLYAGMKPWRVFGVATGQARYPTPLGRWHIVVKWRWPWWYPPASDWAKGLKPVPPGPGNPLGTRWMGLSAESVGIHGTPNGSSIGYSASHGCIRMHIPEAEWLFEQVELGTPVYVVPQ